MRRVALIGAVAARCWAWLAWRRAPRSRPSSTRPGDGRGLRRHPSRPVRGRAHPPGPGHPYLDLLRLGGAAARPCQRRLDDQALTDWWAAASPLASPTGRGSPTCRGSRRGRGRCGWPASAARSPGGSSAGRPSWPKRARDQPATGQVFRPPHAHARPYAFTLRARTHPASDPIVQWSSTPPCRQSDHPHRDGPAEQQALEATQAAGCCQCTRTSTQTRRWSEVGNGKTPTSRNSGSLESGQNTAASRMRRFLLGST
jgi:hypothetical protein